MTLRLRTWAYEQDRQLRCWLFFSSTLKILTLKKLETLSYAAFGWLVWPLRYIDFWLIERSGAYILANHIYALVRTPVG